jgi:density-regulated protein DRP1
MADFAENEPVEKDVAVGETGEETQVAEQAAGEGKDCGEEPVQTDVDARMAAKLARGLIYCPHCTMPPEYCEHGPCFEEKCLPWILENCPEQLSEALLAQYSGEGTAAGEAQDGDGEGDGKKKKKRGGQGPKKKAILETRVVITRIQRQKRKFVTSVQGLETVADLKIKDAAKLFGRKFSSGSSVTDTPQGGKEVVIQGDVSFELPNVLINDLKIPAGVIFTNEDGVVRPYA